MQRASHSKAAVACRQIFHEGRVRTVEAESTKHLSAYAVQEPVRGATSCEAILREAAQRMW
jgi:hypothetical protein